MSAGLLNALSAVRRAKCYADMVVKMTVVNKKCKCGKTLEVQLRVGRDSGHGGHSAFCPVCRQRVGTFPDPVLKVEIMNPPAAQI